MANRDQPAQQPVMDGEDVLAGTDYSVVNLLGRGSRSHVYCGRHRHLGHLVAIKVLQRRDRDSGADKSGTAEISAQHRDRIRLEGQIGARLRHPNLVAVHGAGTTAWGAPYLAMEMLYGESLQERLGDGEACLPLREALDIFGQALAALAAMHEQGLIHRDIKPANLFLCRDGTVKVLDLGFAKVLEQGGPLAPDALHEDTGAHVAIGSPRYMAPEQALAATVDARTDLYALACVLYRMLCGRGPFDAARNPQAMRQAHLSEIPAPPSHRCPSPLPRALDALILQCLHKDPAARPPSASAVTMELHRIERQLRTHTSITSAPHTPQRPHTGGPRMGLALICVVLATLLSTLLSVLLRALLSTTLGASMGMHILALRGP